MKIDAVKDHRSREGGAIIYPVYSRRSKGLSIGVNLFPDRKQCLFDCPYCEIFPFETDIVFSLEIMKTALASAINEAKRNAIPIKDICFSGNGEPTMSPNFPEAVSEAALIRSELAPEAKIVVISNGTGLLHTPIFEFLIHSCTSGMELHLWLKIDAAAETWYKSINRSNIPLEQLISKIHDFAASSAPFTVQTMLCKISGLLPPPEEVSAWVQLITELAVMSSIAGRSSDAGLDPQIRAVHIYGKARSAREDPLAQAVSLAILEERAELLRLSFKKAGINLPVEVFE